MPRRPAATHPTNPNPPRPHHPSSQPPGWHPAWAQDPCGFNSVIGQSINPTGTFDLSPDGATLAIAYSGLHNLSDPFESGAFGVWWGCSCEVRSLATSSSMATALNRPQLAAGVVSSWEKGGLRGICAILLRCHSEGAGWG